MPFSFSPYFTRSLKNLYRLLFFITAALFSACTKPVAGNQNHDTFSDNIIDKANTLLNSGQLKASIVYLDSAYNAFQNPGPLDLWKKYHQRASYYLNYEKKPAIARQNIDSMLFILKGREQQYTTEYASTKFVEGDVLLAEKKYTEAFKSYYDGTQFARKNLDSCSYYQLTYQLGMVRYKQGNYLKAIPYFKQAFTGNRSCKADAGFSYLFIYPQSQLNTIALCFEKLNMPDSAIYYYKQALNFIDRNIGRFPKKNQFAEMARGVIYGNMGGVYVTLNNYAEAEKYLQASIKINNRLGYAVEDAQTARIKLAGLYLRFSHLAAAYEILVNIGDDLACGHGKSSDNDIVWLRWYRLNWEYFEKTNNVSQAYLYAQKYYKFRDSLDEIDKGLKSSDIDMSFKETEQQYKLALISKRDQLKTAYLIGIIVFAVMTVVILLMIGYYLKRSRKSVSELMRLNREVNDHNTQMQRTLTALEQSQAENTRMMQVVAHDLRSPIGGITQVAEMMLEEHDRPEEDRMMLELVKTSGKNSLELISDLLQIHTRLEELKKEPVDMFMLLYYCVELLRFKAREKAQQIDLQGEYLILYINREKIWRVISNLIANAIKFSPSGANISVQLLQKDHHALIIVEDHGIGIPVEMKDKVFDMFTEARRLGTAGEQTHGMGLAISRQIVEVHDGHIWFESKPGNGTSFYVELPING